MVVYYNRQSCVAMMVVIILFGRPWRRRISPPSYLLYIDGTAQTIQQTGSNYSCRKGNGGRLELRSQPERPIQLLLRGFDYWNALTSAILRATTRFQYQIASEGRITTIVGLTLVVMSSARLMPRMRRFRIHSRQS